MSELVGRLEMVVVLLQTAARALAPACSELFLIKVCDLRVRFKRLYEAIWELRRSCALL